MKQILNKMFCLFILAMSSPLITILTNDKLNKDNYVKWKNNMNAIMVYENLKFVLMNESLPMPPANAARNICKTHQN